MTTFTVVRIVEAVFTIGFLIYVWLKLRKDRTEREEFYQTTKQLLATVKGWTIVHDATTKTAVLQISANAVTQTEEVKKALEQVPDKTADVVVQKLQETPSPNQKLETPT